MLRETMGINQNRIRLIVYPLTHPPTALKTQLPEVTDSSAATVAATAAVATATATDTAAVAASSNGYLVSERAKEVKEVAAPYQRGVLC